MPENLKPGIASLGSMNCSAILTTIDHCRVMSQRFFMLSCPLNKSLNFSVNEKLWEIKKKHGFFTLEKNLRKKDYFNNQLANVHFYTLK